MRRWGSRFFPHKSLSAPKQENPQLLECSRCAPVCSLLFCRLRRPPCCRSTSPKSHPAVGIPVPDRKCGTRLTCGSGAMRRAILQMALVCSAFLKTCQFIVHMAAVCSGCVPACSAKPTITSVFRGVRLGYILLYVRNVVAGARAVLRPHIEYYTGALFSILPRCSAPPRQPSRTPGGLGSGKRARSSGGLGSGNRAKSSGEPHTAWRASHRLRPEGCETGAKPGVSGCISDLSVGGRDCRGGASTTRRGEAPAWDQQKRIAVAAE